MGESDHEEEDFDAGHDVNGGDQTTSGPGVVASNNNSRVSNTNNNETSRVGATSNSNGNGYGIAPEVAAATANFLANAPPNEGGLLPPGAYSIAGPGFPGDDVGGNDVDRGEEEAVFEGFLPEQCETEEEVLRREANEMLRSAITLDEAAVRPIESGDQARAPSTTVGAETRGDPALNVANDSRTNPVDHDAGSTPSSEGIVHKYLKPVSVFLLTLLILAGIALGVAFGGGEDAAGEDATGVAPAGEAAAGEDAAGDAAAGEDAAEVSGSCITSVQDRYDHAKTIVSKITSPETLEDATSPQNKALEWIVCQDKLSSGLIDDRDPATGVLPRQAHGTKHGGDSGEAQILRRYSLAVFFFSASEDGPWIEAWNFLSPDLHECGWHEPKERGNFPYGEFDPAGFVCLSEDLVTGELEIMPDDAERAITEVDFNFRIPNNLTGTLPPEFGHLEDTTTLALENQGGLRGDLPFTIGNMRNLRSFTIIFAGSDLGGVIPPSLFEIPSIEYISFLFNEGTWELPRSVASGAGPKLLQLSVRSSGLSGSLPSFFSTFPSLMQLDLSENFLEGSIPDLQGIPTLEYLNLLDNNLTGTLPRLWQLPKLVTLVLGKNGLGGTLPPSLGDLGALRLLDLSFNELEGPVPGAFSRLQSLEHVSLQHNALTGSISAFEPLGGLVSLLLYSNRFSSTVPSGLFSNATGRIFADFGHNNFTGSLPGTLMQWAPNTTYLATMGNNFDAEAVGDEFCEEVPTLFADCSSCPCCSFCCSEDSVDASNPPCHFELDFYALTGLHCGSWWVACFDRDYGVHGVPYEPLPED